MGLVRIAEPKKKFGLTKSINKAAEEASARVAESHFEDSSLGEAPLFTTRL